jgi:hypothetical protein
MPTFIDAVMHVDTSTPTHTKHAKPVIQKHSLKKILKFSINAIMLHLVKLWFLP